MLLIQRLVAPSLRPPKPPAKRRKTEESPGTTKCNYSGKIKHTEGDVATTLQTRALCTCWIVHHADYARRNTVHKIVLTYNWDTSFYLFVCLRT